MILESVLAAAHLIAVLAMVVFISSATALCRPEFMSAAVLARLARVHGIYLGALGAVWLTGLLRLGLGAKGASWYLGNPLMGAKLAVLGLVTAWALRSMRILRRWDALPQPPLGEEVSRLRAALMRAAHVMVAAPLLAVFIARGFGA